VDRRDGLQTTEEQRQLMSQLITHVIDGTSIPGNSTLLAEGNEANHGQHERSTSIPKLTFESGEDSNVIAECVDGDDGDIKVVFHVYYV